MSVTAMPFGDFICPKCAGALHEQNAEALMCVGCGQTYPVMQGVPLLLPGMAVSPGPPSDNAFISEMAHAALFLCSDEAEFITGVGLPVDGGTLSIR